MKLLRRMFLPLETTGPRDFALRFVQLMTGLFLYGTALALMIRAGVGVAPWDVLSLGIQRHTGLPFGLITSLTSVVVLLVWIPLRQRVGLGSLLNGLTIGPFADLGMLVIPEVSTLWIRVPMFAVGLVLLAFATGMYIAARFGPGPRDGLMTGLIRVTGWPVWVVRTLIEGSVLTIGWLLGGPVGLGTVAFAFGVGPLIGCFLPWFERRREPRSVGELAASGASDVVAEERHDAA